MSKKLTTKEFINRARSVHGLKYNYDKVIYINALSAVIIICPIDGEFSQTPNNHINCEHICPKCGERSKRAKKTSTTEEFITKAMKVHSSTYDYGKVVYIKALKEIIIICFTHGEFSQTPHNHLKGQGCPKCGIKKRSLKGTSTTEEFIIKAIKIHSNKYDYGKVDYIDCHKNVINICSEHGEFLQTPAAHLRGQGCPKCAGNKRTTAEEFAIKARKVHRDYYDYGKVVYINCETEVIIICPVDGEFKQTPNSHLSGKGCPICKKSNGEKKIIKLLDNKNIEYIKQKTFLDCINPKTKWKLKYDFYLPKYNMLIEYNGMQHYINIDYWHKNGQSLKYQQFRDQIKKDYALSHDYKFLIIKYNENIEEILKEIL